MDGFVFESDKKLSALSEVCLYYLISTEFRYNERLVEKEWKDNFKPFDMSIFDSENVTKWERGIHAWGNDKAYEYIRKVKDLVNPKP